MKWTLLPSLGGETRHLSAAGARWLTREGVEVRALVGHRGVSYTKREIHFLCDECGLAGYTCHMWQSWGVLGLTMVG